MSVEAVRRFFQDKGLKDPIFELSESIATVELAAQAIGVAPELIAKTLAFKVKDRNILIVTKGDARIDNKKYKHFFGTKAKMLEHEEVEAVTGHPAGGVCPFGLSTPMEIYLDTSLKAFEKVYPAAGSRNAALEIVPEELQKLTQAVWVDVCQDKVEG